MPSAAFLLVLEVLEEDVDTDDGGGAEDRFRKHAEAAETTDRCRTPNGGCGGETFDRVAVFEDDTGS